MSSLDETHVNRTIDDAVDACVNVETLEPGLLDQSSVVDVSQSASIRTSRRKMKSGSSVVLNTNRLQKYIQKDVEDNVPENSLSQILDFKEQYLQKMATSKPSADPRVIEFKRKVVLVKLQRWWRRRIDNRDRNYVQQGAWRLHTSDEVFSLFLGYRVRKLMRSPGLIANVKAQQDIHRILSDMCNTIVPVGSGASGDKWEKFQRELQMNSVDDLLLRYPSLTHTDMMLAKSMSRQLLTERQKLHNLVFGGSKWQQFPSPGFWDLTAALRTARVLTQRQHAHTHGSTDSPSRKPLNKSNMETPPNVRRAVKISSANAKPMPSELNLNKNNSHLIEDRNSSFSTPPAGMQERPIQSRGSLEEGVFVNRLRHSGDRPERVVDPHLLMLTPEAEQAPHVPRVRREPREPRELKQPRESPTSSSAVGQGSVEKVRTIRSPVAQSGSTSHSAHPPHHVHSKSMGSLGSGQKSKADAVTTSQAQAAHCERRRESSKGHLQLHILSGEKLMAARKGAPVRDSMGSAVADRIPCLKVKLMLPNWSGSGARGAPSPDPIGAQGLKKVYEKIKDYTVTTLNPQWNAHFSLNFPCPRAVVQSIVSELRLSPYDSEGQLTDAAFESIRRALLQWWSLGVVNIEVFDGERFNQEIFMGQFDLLLNGFMVLIKKPDDLEVKGNFQLCKMKPTDRISGSIKIQSYLHPPEKSYIVELLEASLRVSQSQAPIAHLEMNTAADHDGIDARLGARSPTGGEAGEQSTSTSTTSSGEQSSSSGVVYSSRFMQTLLRNSKQHGALFESVVPPPPPPPASTSMNREVSSHEKAKAEQPVRTGGFASRFFEDEPSAGSEHFLRDPHLEESDNIRFNVQSGRMASQMDISESARLLKEKLRRGRPSSRKGAAPPPPPLSLQPQKARAEVDALEQTVVIPQYQAPVHVHHRSQSASAVPSTSAAVHSTQLQESVRGHSGLGGSKSMKASKEQSVDASALRRVSMVDVSKRLAGLTALQYSTEAVLDNLNIKLEAKLRERGAAAAGAHSEGRPSPQKLSQSHTPVRAEPAVARSPHREIITVQLDLSIDQEESDEQLNMPNTAEIRRAMLSSSFRSSREEDEDAPEMGAETDDSHSEHFHDPRDTDSFEDAFDEEDNEDFRESHDLGGEQGYEKQFLDRKQAFASDDYSFSEGGFGGRMDHSDIPVIAAQRRHVHPSAQLAGRQVPNARSEDVDTIYLDEEEDQDAEFSDEEGFESDVDRTKAAVYNNSTLSSEYSVNVQEFLSPDPHRSPRRGALLMQDDHPSDEELIVMESSPSTRSFDDYGSPMDGRVVLKGQSPKSPRLFEVRSVHDLLCSSDSVGDQPRGHSTKNAKSPSRSLFDLSNNLEENQSKPGHFSSPTRHERAPREGSSSAQRRRVTGGKEGVSPSPRREQIRRVVLELDGLEL